MLDTFKELIPQNWKNFYHLGQAFLANVYYGWPSRRLKVIGVTGTDGKTTTTHLIYEVLKEAGFKVSMISTIAAFIGREKVDIGFHITTPRFFPLQWLLKKAVDSSSEYIVLEVTSHGLDQNRLWGVPFFIGVFTNLTHEHLDYHRSMDNYLKAKLKMFQGTQFAILNSDDPNFKKMEREVKGRVVTYGIDHQAQVKAQAIKEKNQSMEFEAEEMKIHLPLFGTYNVYNALAAIAVGEALGIANSKIKVALEAFPGVAGRMEKVDNDCNLNIFIDFAHTPNGVENVLSNLKKVIKGRLIVLFGSAGKRDSAKRPLMGKAAKKYADITVLTAEDPRGEDVTEISWQIAADNGFKENEDLFIVPDRKEAINLAINQVAKAGDTVVFLGKSHEKSQNLDGQKELPWDEFATVKEALNNRNHG